MKLNQVDHIKDVEKAGDYAICNGGLVLACPFCGQEMSCSHTVVNPNPLTLSPSVVGPQNAVVKCTHHFMVKNGEAE